MGNVLVIKNADFSNNAVDFVFDKLTYTVLNPGIWAAETNYMNVGTAISIWYRIPANTSKLRIEAGPNKSYYVFVKSLLHSDVGGDYDFATGVEQRVTIPENGVVTVDVPNDAVYLVCPGSYTGGSLTDYTDTENRTPKSVIPTV